MRVGFLGAGQLAQTIGKALIVAHHQVVLTNSRGPETLAGVLAEMGPNCSATVPDRLKDECEVVILAIRWQQRETALKGLPDWDGTIVVDTLNNRKGPRREDVIDIGDTTSSEMVAELLPGAKVVKALNHAQIPLMAEPNGGALFYCGDDVAAKAVVASLLKDIGATPIDTGNLHDGGMLQGTGHRLAGHGNLLTVEQAQRYIDA
jgi:8-hydroxy-5-deazaflavin:NADPH oxidoreductase